MVICGGAGAIIGALATKDLKGALIGAGIGAAACALITKLAEDAAIEAAKTNKPVIREKISEEGKTYVVKAQPVAYNLETKCKTIKNEIKENGKIISTVPEEVCQDRNGNWQLKI
ncbi:MAG TPA: hypothetical protein DIT25_02050 [Candidatus Moranbacteria bacterium]|nr:hypothetical protein [Candidatus Moranbacteria bacterium]